MGQSGEIQKLQDGLTTLGGARAGRSITAAIREHGTAVRFGQTDEDAIAYFGIKVKVTRTHTCGIMGRDQQHRRRSAVHGQESQALGSESAVHLQSGV